MEIVKLLLITVLPALVLGCIAGVLTGRYRVKKASGRLRPVLTPRQRVLCSISVLAGITCVLIGIFYSPDPGEASGGGMAGDGAYFGGDVLDFGEPGLEPDDEEGLLADEDAVTDGVLVDGEAVEDGEAAQAEAEDDISEDKPASSASSGGSGNNTATVQPRRTPGAATFRSSGGSGRAVRIG